MSTDVTTQIASYAYHPKSVQQQGNGVDCGVYARALATSLAYGGNSGKEGYDIKED